MPRLRLPRRRAHQEDIDDQSLLSVPEEDAGDESDFTPEAIYRPPEEDSKRRLPRLRLPGLPHLRRPSVGWSIRWDELLVVILLVAAGIFGTLLKLDRLRSDVETWWPVAVLVVAGLWMLIALARRRVASFLGGAALSGAGLSLLMDLQDIAPLNDTLLGLVLVTLGLGIVIRGFLLRQHLPA